MAQQPIDKAQLTSDLNDSVQWKGGWVDGTYITNDMVRDGDWTMVVNGNNPSTTDRAAPQTKGSPENSINPTQALTPTSDTSVVKMVHNFTMLKTGWLQQLQVRVPFWDLDSVSRVTLVDVTNGGAVVINNPILKSDDWVNLLIGNTLYEAGTVGEVWFEFYNSTKVNNINGDWKSNIGTGIPSNEEFNIDNAINPTVIEIDHDDLSSTDRSTELDGVVAGSIILIAESGDITHNVQVEVVTVDTTSATSTKYTVTLLDNGSKDIRDNLPCTISIDVPITQPSQYDVITDYYLGSTNQPSWATIVSRLYYDGVQQADVNDAYGINILFQEASFSADWDMVANSDGGGASGNPVPDEPIIKYKTSTTAKSADTTLANDPQLFGFVLEASSFYIIEGAFFYAANSVTPDLKMAWVKSTGTVTDSFSLMAAQSNSLGGIQEVSGLLSGIKIIDITQTGARHAVLSGYVSTSAALTLDFQWAQNVSDPANVSMLNGSWVKFTKVS